MRDRYNDNAGGYEERQAPVNVGDEFETTIEAVGEKGDGLAKKDGFVLFVPNGKKGERVKIRVTRVLKKVGFAEIVGKVAGAASESNDEPMEGTQEEPASAQEEAYQDSENFGEDEDQ